MPLKRKWNDYVDQILEMKKQRTEAVVPPPRPIENFWVKKSELRNYANYEGKILGQKSELRNYANYGGKFLGQKS